jgi:hypothetical protein
MPCRGAGSQASTRLGAPSSCHTRSKLISLRGEAEAQVKGFTNPKHKKFRTTREAQEWIASLDDGKPSAMTTIATARLPSASPLVVGPSASTSSVYKGRSAVQAAATFDPLAAEIVAYTDGAAKNNQEGSKRIAGFGVHWAVGRPRDVECVPYGYHLKLASY